jgi:hypothetical protein
MPERPNYYLLLDLDPSVDDWAVIEKRLQEKRRQWSTEKTMGNPASQRRAGHYLSIVKDIEETLKNVGGRAQEAREARKQQEQERQAKLIELDEFIRILKASGLCTLEQMKQLSKGLSRWVSEKEIESRIRKAGIPIAEAKRGTIGPFRERIDQTVASRIHANLAVSRHTDLYDFLGLNPQSSFRSLRERATEINNEILRIGKTDPLSSAHKELAGICLAVFREEKEKEKYDNARAVEAMSQLKGMIELAGQDSCFISLRAMDELLRQSGERGVKLDDARFFIEDYARKRKWVVQPAERIASSRSLEPLGIASPTSNKAYPPNDSIRRSPNPLRVFLCHSQDDKPAVRDLYCRLRYQGSAPWLDEYELLPGHRWKQEIRKAVRDSDVVIVCLSKASITKRGYVQKEIRLALDAAEELPDGTIFIIPLKLEDCDVPDRLRRYQSVSILESNGYEKLWLSLDRRCNQSFVRGR